MVVSIKLMLNRASSLYPLKMAQKPEKRVRNALTRQLGETRGSMHKTFSKYRDKQPRLVSFKSAQSCEASIACEDPKKQAKLAQNCHFKTVCSQPFLAQQRPKTAEKRLKDG
jgi:hypothetical protein